MNTVNVVLCFAIGIGMGFGIHRALPETQKAEGILNYQNGLIEVCEENLPRDQFCLIKSSAYVRNKK